MTATNTTPPKTPAAFTQCRRIGTSGAVLLAVGGWTVGALPAHDATGLWRDRGLNATTVGGIITYLGLVLLVCAWWRLGRLLGNDRESAAGRGHGDGSDPDGRGASIGAGRLRRVLLWWAAPLVVGPPLFSSDVYSYIAQGVMSARGFDVYTLGPSVLGGPLVDSIPGMWQHTPAPYGPAFVGMAQAVVGLTGSSAVPAVLGMRALAVVALAVIVWATHALARSLGVSESTALWAGALNPLVLIHLVAGAHNDALMIALMMTGLVLARRGRLLWAVAVVSLATIVKAPAAVSFLFLVPMSPRWQGRIWPGLWRVLAGAGVVAAVTTAVSVATGRGLGWVAALRTPVSVESVWSFSTDVGRLVAWIAAASQEAGDGSDGSGLSGQTAIAAVRAACLLAALVGVVYWARRAPRVGPEFALGLALLTLVALSPVVQPWYVLWGWLPLAATAAHRLTGPWAKGLVAVLCFAVLPDGGAPTTLDLVCAALGVVLGLIVAYGPAALWWEPDDGSLSRTWPVP